MKASDLQKAHYEQSDYPENYEGPRVKKIRNIFAQFKEKRKILDVGCANGAILGRMAGFHEIHGVDISEPLVKLAQEQGIQARYHDLEGSPLPYPDKTFDVILCGEVIEHHVDTDWLISEINRVLKPGGKLVLTFPNIRTLLSLAMMLFFDLPPMYSARYRAPHFRDFTLKTVRIVMRMHGFALDRATGSAFFMPKVGEVCSGLASFFPSWASTVIVQATKVKDSAYSAEDAIASKIYEFDEAPRSFSKVT